MYVTKLGPVETGDGAINVYVGFTEHGVTPPVLALRDAEGLEQLLPHTDGEALRCDRSLARAGKRLGFSAAPVPAFALEARATLAFGLAQGNNVRRMNPDVVAEFLKAAAVFLRAAPWRWWSDCDALAVILTADVSRTYEASLLGAGGQEYGIALYEEREALDRIARLADAGRMEDSTRSRPGRGRQSGTSAGFHAFLCP